MPVKRYRLDDSLCVDVDLGRNCDAKMSEHGYGDWVEYDDYVILEERYLEAKDKAAKYLSDWIKQQKRIDKIKADKYRPLISLEKFAAYYYFLGITNKWLKDEVEAGRIPALKIGKRYIFNFDEVRNILIERTGGMIQSNDDLADTKNESIDNLTDNIGDNCNE